MKNTLSKSEIFKLANFLLANASPYDMSEALKMAYGTMPFRDRFIYDATFYEDRVVIFSYSSEYDYEESEGYKRTTIKI